MKGVLDTLMPHLPEDWAGRRITIEWADCTKHTGCMPEWTATIETLSDDRTHAIGHGDSPAEAIEGLLRDLGVDDD